MANPLSRSSPPLRSDALVVTRPATRIPSATKFPADEQAEQDERRRASPDETVAADREQEIDRQKQRGSSEKEPDPPREPQQLPALRSADDRQHDEHEEHEDRRWRGLQTSLSPLVRVVRVHPALVLLGAHRSCRGRRSDPICLDRTMQPDRLLTKPFVLTMLAEFALCMSIGMLLAVVPVYADDELGVGQLRRRRGGRGGQPDGPRLPAARGSLRGPERPADPRRRGRRSLAAVAVAGTSSPTRSRSSSLLRLLTGAGEAMALVGAATIVTDLAPEHRRGEALSLFSLGLWGGLALGPLLGELVLDDTRFDAVWLLAAACCLARRADRAPASRDAHRPERPKPESTARLVHPAAVGPGLVLSFTVLGFAGLGTFGALYARDLGLDGAGSVFLVFSVVVVATRVLARQVPDRLGPKRTSRIALGLIAAGLFTIGLWNVPAGLFVGTVVVAFGHALAFPSLMTLAVNSAPGERAQLDRRHVQRLHGARLPRRRARASARSPRRPATTASSSSARSGRSSASLVLSRISTPRRGRRRSTPRSARSSGCRGALGGDEVAVPVEAVLRHALERLEVDVDDPEAPREAERPLEVVEQRPEEVARARERLPRSHPASAARCRST